MTGPTPIRSKFCLPIKAHWIVIIIAILAALGSAAKSATPFPNAPEARFEVTVTGSGKDVILIPGLGSSSAVWDQSVAALSPHYRLHVLNISGFAGAPAGANAHGPVLKPVTEALMAYIKDNQLDKPSIIGHSLGGLLGLNLATQSPELLDRLIVVDALPFYGALMMPGATSESVAPIANNFGSSLMSMTNEAFAISQKRGAAALVSAPYIDLVTEWSVKSDRSVFVTALKEDMVMDLRPKLKSIKTKTYVFVATSPASPYSPEATENFYKGQYQGLENAQFVRFENSLHFIMFDQKEAFIKALKSALP